jgi:hypothetical protein
MSQENNPQFEIAEAMDFLTPEQRCDAIAEIMATIALRVIKADHEKNQNI